MCSIKKLKTKTEKEDCKQDYSKLIGLRAVVKNWYGVIFDGFISNVFISSSSDDHIFEIKTEKKILCFKYFKKKYVNKESVYVCKA